MKKKSHKVTQFIQGLHKYIANHPQFRLKTNGKSEAVIQTELRPLIINYLEAYFNKAGYKDYTKKAHNSFYWERQEGKYEFERRMTFGSRNYPDFIITAPYRIAVEYKKSSSGSTVKYGIGQSIMHTLSGEYDYAYFLFHDESTEKKISKAFRNDFEKDLIDKFWKDFNVMIKTIGI